MTDKLRLVKALSRYKKQELIEDVPTLLGFDTSRLPEEKLLARSRKTKRELVSSLVDECLERNATDVDILDLELQYAAAHPNSHTWKAYRLERSESTSSSADLDPNIFSKRFQLYFNGVCDYELTQDLKPSGHWFCLRLKETDNIPYTCYILRCPPAPFLLIAGLKKKHLELVLEVLALALDCRGFTDLNLSGKNLDSLTDSLMYQHCQGTYSKYRYNQVDPNPLLGVAASRKRSKVVTQSLEDDKENLEVNQKSKRRKAADEAFGTNPLPKLEKFTIQLRSRPISDSNETVTCKVKFSGSNVLEGIKESVACGCVATPIPTVLKSLPRCSTNRVTVEIENQPSPLLGNHNGNTNMDHDKNS